MNSPEPRVHVASIFQLLLSGLGLAFSTLIAAGLLVFGLLSLRGSTSIAASQASAMIALAWTFGVIALAALPSIWFSANRLFFARPPRSEPSGLTSPPARNGLRRLGIASIGLAIWPLLLWLGHSIASRGDLSWLFLPPLQILVVIIPLWWVIEFARHGLPGSTPQRAWGAFNFSLFFSTPLVIVLEIIGTIAVLIGIVVVAGLQPSLQGLINRLSAQIISSNGDPEILLQTYKPYLSNPWVIFSFLTVLSALVPLVEEFCKPLAVWMLLGRRLTPSEGFIAGACAGAGFALVETLFSLSNPSGASWVSLVVGRAGTGLLHTTNAALMGLALANVLKAGQIPLGNYIRLGLTYFFTAVLHGSWNAFSILSGFGPLMPVDTGISGVIKNIGTHASTGLAFLVIIFLVILWSTNLRLRRAADEEVSSGLLAPEVAADRSDSNPNT